VADPVLGLGDTLVPADAEPLGEADELEDAEPLADVDGLVVGVAATSALAATHCTPTPEHKSTCRNLSCAVVPTRATTFWEVWPGTDTVMF
jgi:hypothetical protein